MGPGQIYAVGAGLSQGGLESGLVAVAVAVVAVVALGIAACKEPLVELIRSLSTLRVRAGKDVDVDARFKGQTSPPSGRTPSRPKAKAKAKPDTSQQDS